ncbi:hypothetical protein QWJ34_15640 [Saccharibacillus sp. CPCC 101409]|uniref:hypothetical protein n=1 Tax=Saccharibacillus sp. CPCC 101409 TaxID=3058041 RepID=UPI00267322D0|nr:hypothetical protein [Saccharibacillus sp. CPCC 101409]MDO3411198.1 hypothetical protein [Saccharibacillus sp. CPCC 101409]
MDFLQELIAQYGYDEPILSEQLRNDTALKDEALRQRLKRLVEQGKLLRYDNGIYFIPNPNSVLKKKTLSFNKVVKRKYLYYNSATIGYRTGVSFANELNLTTQTAGTLEIVTNKETNIKRLKKIKERPIILRKPRVPVTEENYKLLQVIDLLSSADRFSEKNNEQTLSAVLDYLQDSSLSSKQLREILKSYPFKTRAKIYESGLYDAIAQR